VVDAFRCWRCGATNSPGAQFCGDCGQNLTEGPPWPGAQPYSGPGTGTQPSPAAWSQPLVSPAAAPRPFGIVIVAAVLAVTAVLGLFLTYDYGYWSVWRFDREEALWALVDAAFAAAYVATSILAFVTLPRIWAIEPPAWKTTSLLAVAWLGLDLADVVLWGAGSSSIVGVVVFVGLLVYLNLTPVRVRFGRAPLVTPAEPA
jgi:uncharacterized membrane protein YgdD (TMEM256/DUF423 family)